MSAHPKDLSGPGVSEALASTEVDARAPRKTGTCSTCGHRHRPKREITPELKYRGVRGLITAYPKWADRFGPVALGDVWRLRSILDNVIDQIVDKCLADPWSASWTEIGDQTGMSKQAAQKRWGYLGSARRPGGQPGNLR